MLLLRLLQFLTFVVILWDSIVLSLAILTSVMVALRKSITAVAHLFIFKNNASQS